LRGGNAATINCLDSSTVWILYLREAWWAITRMRDREIGIGTGSDHENGVVFEDDRFEDVDSRRGTVRRE
jgi:hypothetical protein